MILVSACLLGHHTKYDGGSNATPILMNHTGKKQFIAFCPEQLGGLLTPRDAAEILCGSGEDVLLGRCKVSTRFGKDVTEYFLSGAEKSAQLAVHHNVTAAILKQRSPSCGYRQIYDGTFNHRIRSGMGVTAAILYQLGIPLYSDTEITPELLEELLTTDTD